VAESIERCRRYRGNADARREFLGEVARFAAALERILTTHLKRDTFAPLVRTFAEYAAGFEFPRPDDERRVRFQGKIEAAITARDPDLGRHLVNQYHGGR